MIVNAILMIGYINASWWFTMYGYLDRQQDYNYLNGNRFINRSYWYMILSFLAVQYITNYGYISFTHPLYFYAIVMLPLVAGW